MTVTLTEKAELRLRAFLLGSSDKESPAKGVRIGVSDGGCSGYQYTLNIVGSPNTEDVTFQHGRVNVYVDPQSLALIDGVVVDYVEGIMESGFKFSNPNATESCGCGSSFKAGDCTPQGVPCS